MVFLFISRLSEPAQVEFYDNVASVSALSFTDQDADAEEIGGRVESPSIGWGVDGRFRVISP